jgi:hypothetical protein
MVQGEGQKNSPPPESSRRSGAAQTPPEKPFHEELNRLSPEKSMELFLKATGGSLNPSKPGNDQSMLPARDIRGSDPAAQAPDQENKKGSRAQTPLTTEKPEDPNQQDQQESMLDYLGRPIDPLVKPIYDALDILNKKHSPINWTGDELTRADKILQEAGIREPTAKQKEAVLHAERILDQPGFREPGFIDQDTRKFVHTHNFAEAILKKAGIEAPNSEQINKLLTATKLLGKSEKERVIIDEKTGKHVDVINLWEKEIRGHMQYGGPNTDSHAITMYKIANILRRSGDSDLAAYYYEQGIPITKQANPKTWQHNAMLAEQHYGASSRGMNNNDKSKEEWQRREDYHLGTATQMCLDIYRQYPDPQTIPPALHEMMKEIHNTYLVDLSLKMSLQSENAGNRQIELREKIEKAREEHERIGRRQPLP